VAVVSLHVYILWLHRASLVTNTLLSKYALNNINCRIVKNTLRIQNLLRHVSGHAGTIIREPKSVPS